MIGAEDFCEKTPMVDDMAGRWVDVILRLDLSASARISQQQVGELHMREAITRTRQMVRDVIVDRVYGDLDRHMQLLVQRIWDAWNSGQNLDTVNVAVNGIGELRDMIAACAKVEDMP